MDEVRSRPLVVLLLILVSIAKIVTILVGIVWLETYWVANPPRPDTTFAIFIVWTLVDLPIAIGLWFPQRLAWIGAFSYDLFHITMFLQILLMFQDSLAPFMIIVVILAVIRLLLMLMLETRKHYQIFLR